VTTATDTTIALPLCSVVCLTYNHTDYSAAAIASVAEQTYPNIEIIVVDDGSTDGNADVVEAALKSCGRPYKFLRQENTGNIAMNMNRGIAAATGDYMSMFSLDDLLLPDCIATKMDLLNADPKLAFVANTCNMEVDGAGGVTDPLFKSGLYHSDIATAEALLEHEFEHIGTIYVQGGVIAADIIRTIRGYDEDLKGDDLIIRTKIFRHMLEHPELGFRLLHTQGFQYRKHGENIHRNSWRQVKLVLEWRDRYFLDRPMPLLWRLWVVHALSKSIAQGDMDEVASMTSAHPEIAEVYSEYRGTWKYRRRAVKTSIRRLFART
jgi:alpha-1,3-rhamnosyltransferase